MPIIFIYFIQMPVLFIYFRNLIEDSSTQHIPSRPTVKNGFLVQRNAQIHRNPSQSDKAQKDKKRKKKKGYIWQLFFWAVNSFITQQQQKENR